MPTDDDSDVCRRASQEKESGRQLVQWRERERAREGESERVREREIESERERGRERERGSVEWRGCLYRRSSNCHDAVYACFRYQLQNIYTSTAIEHNIRS